MIVSVAGTCACAESEEAAITKKRVANTENAKIRERVMGKFLLEARTGCPLPSSKRGRDYTFVRLPRTKNIVRSLLDRGVCKILQWGSRLPDR
jgi:hypothetical protein